MKNISAIDVKKLRDITGLGFSDCKKALENSDGDFDKAKIFLKEKGLKISLLRSDKVATEGIVFSKVEDNRFGVAICIICETDFVAKNDEFFDIIKKITDVGLRFKIKSLDELLDYSFEDMKVKDLIINFSAKVGEKIFIRDYNFIYFEKNEFLYCYNHQTRQICSLISISGVESNILNDSIKELAKDICMHIVACNPFGISISDLSEDFVKSELELAKKKALESGKSEEIVNKIAQGILQKNLGEVSLYTQDFFKDPKYKILDLIKNFSKNLEIKSFIRVSVKNN
jgi:elongation factor Ts